METRERKGAYLIPNSGPYEELGRGRILFVDAGSFTHPFTGEGIYHAILSGQAAETISTHKLGDELTQLYEQIVEKYGLLRLRGLSPYMNVVRDNWRSLRKQFLPFSYK